MDNSNRAIAKRLQELTDAFNEHLREAPWKQNQKAVNHQIDPVEEHDAKQEPTKVFGGIHAASEQLSETPRKTANGERPLFR